VGGQSRSGHGGEEKNSQPLPGLGPQIVEYVSKKKVQLLLLLLLLLLLPPPPMCNLYLQLETKS
jgi:hypothetical protein